MWFFLRAEEQTTGKTKDYSVMGLPPSQKAAGLNN